jgi:hypothetical protein
MAIDDEELMQEVALAVTQERDVPDHRRRAAEGAFAWRHVDDELLALTHDSLVVADAAVRGVDDVRTFGFQGDGLALEIEVDDGQLFGQVLHVVVDQVSVESSTGEVQVVATDPSGVFSVTVAGGPVRFAVEVAGVVRRTAWVVV